MAANIAQLNGRLIADRFTASRSRHNATLFNLPVAIQGRRIRKWETTGMRGTDCVGDGADKLEYTQGAARIAIHAGVC